jgi:signal transduction histidine kinase
LSQKIKVKISNIKVILLKRINLKNIIAISILFLFTSTITLLTIEENSKERIYNVLNTHNKTLETSYKVLSYNQTSLADITYKETLNNKKFLKIYEKANIAKNNNDTNLVNNLREEAKELLTKRYKFLKMQGILQYHFIFPDNTVFLRMHKPTKFGDSIAKVRPDFVRANKELKIIRGFAQGRTAHGFRNVYPVMGDNDEHLGAMEISFSSELLQNYFTDINQLHTHFLVRKDIFDSHAWKRDDLVLKYHQSAEHEEYMLTMTNKHTKQRCILTNEKRIKDIKNDIKSHMSEDNPFTLYNDFLGSTNVISFYPIKHNVTKEIVAWIVSYQKEKVIKQIKQNTLYLQILIIFFLLLIAFFIYFLLNQKTILNDMVKEQTQNLLNVNKNLEESEEELQLVNENLQVLVQEEVAKNKEKDKILYEQTKMAAMGEMIGNIAHQWRQPLSVISTSASGMQTKKEFGLLNDDEFNHFCELINDNAQYLSQTIDDFRDFIRGDSKKELFNLSKSVDSFLHLVNASIKEHQIKVKIDIDTNIELIGLPHELNQTFINLFNNSKDALKSLDEESRLIFISADIQDKQIIINFKDNGGGIKDKIIDKVFEPYFTTKHQSQGTGLGLHMVYRMIVEGMGGTIHVENDTFSHESTEYTGAVFTITLPMQ